MTDNGPRSDGGEARLWAAYDRLLRRLLVLEEIAERLAATAADPIAVADYWAWRGEGHIQ